MKKMMFVCLLSLMTIGGLEAQSVTVESDRSLEADFSKYKSFYWSSQADAWLDDGVYFMNDLGMKAMIRDAVKGELLGLGYQMQSDEPDIVVSFRVFDQPTTIRGFEGYGTSYWGNEEYRQISDTASYAVEAGTLLVSMADRESGQVVWQGFASGLIDGDHFLKDEGKIREAVNLIFDEYNQRAREYSRR